MIFINNLKNVPRDSDFYVCSLIETNKYLYDCYLKSLAPPWYIKKDLESGLITRKEFLQRYEKFLLTLKDPDFPDSLLLLERLSSIIHKKIVIVDTTDYSQSLRRVIFNVSKNNFNINLINSEVDEKSN